MSIPNIRLAFQGGGAKFVSMLPIADAFLEAQDQRLLHIDAVSGTSAGALCAALVATKADMSEVRKFTREHGRLLLPTLVQANLAEIQRKLKIGKTPGILDVLGNIGFLINVLWKGQPVLNQLALKTFVTQLLEKATGESAHKIETTPSKLKIIASNVVKSEGVIHEQGDLVLALLDSCSLPILLRSFETLRSTHHVDGGLCDNLPVEGLLGNPEMPVFAVYPKPTVEAPDISNIIKYLVALFSASINHSVQRSTAMVASPFRFEINTKLSLLDFDKAIEQLADNDWYKTEKSNAFARIENFSKSFGVVNTKHQARVLDVVNVEEYEKTIFNITKSSLDKFELLKGRFMVRINSPKIFADAKSAAADRLSDTVTRITQLVAMEDGAPFYRANTAMDNESIISTVWSAVNLTKNSEIPIRAVPVGQRFFNGKSLRYCLIEFLEPEKYISKGDTIEIQSVYHTPNIADMKNINIGKADHFGFTNDQEKSVADAELVLIYPSVLGRVSLTAHPDRCSRKQDVTPMQFARDELTILGDGVSMCGISITNLGPGEAIFALATPH